MSQMQFKCNKKVQCVSKNLPTSAGISISFVSAGKSHNEFIGKYKCIAVLSKEAMTHSLFNFDYLYLSGTNVVGQI